MKQWQLSDEPGFDRLHQVEVETPRLGAGEVLVRLRAASLNFRDLLIARGESGLKPLQGRVPLSDGAGQVEAVGQGVTDWKTGDRVAGTFFRDWVSGRFRMSYHEAALGGSVDGVLRESGVFPAHGLVRLPEHFTFEEGATLPCAGLTAWYSLVTRGGLRPGETVLLLGTGGVSVWGLQIAAASGTQTIITSSSDDKLAQAKELGASHLINYKATPDWDKEVWKLTGKRGADHVLEVGGPGTLGKSLGSVSAGGHVALIGVLTGFGPSDASLFALTSRNASASGIYVGDRESFQEFVRFLEVTRIKPVIDRTFGFDQAREAFKYMETGSHFGKVVISM